MAHKRIDTEYSGLPMHGMEGWRSLSTKTGLSFERVATLGLDGNLGVLFANGRLRSGEELRALDHAGHLGPPVEQRSVQQRIVELLAKRWPEPPAVAARRRILELHRKRAGWTK